MGTDEEVKMFRKFKKEEELDPDQKDKDIKVKSDEKKFNDIIKKIEDRQVISRDEFRIYEKHEKFETYTKDWYPFKCPACSDSYDVIVRGNTADEKTLQIIYVEDEKIENTEKKLNPD